MRVSNLCRKDVGSHCKDGVCGVCLLQGSEREWIMLSEERIFKLVASVC